MAYSLNRLDCWSGNGWVFTVQSGSTPGESKCYLNGELHCETGPAVIRTDNTVEYWFHGRNLTEKEFETALIMEK